MIEFFRIEDAQTCFSCTELLYFFGSKLTIKQSKHESINAAAGYHCKDFSNISVLPQISFPPTNIVRFYGLCPLVSNSPNIVYSICHYFDYYGVPRPVEVTFTSNKYVNI